MGSTEENERNVSTFSGAQPSEAPIGFSLDKLWGLPQWFR